MPTAINNGGPPMTMGPYGFWLDASGGVAATDPQGNPQLTPGMAANPQGAIYYDPAKDLYYNLVNGSKQYQSPYAYKGQSQGTGHGMTNPGGSLTQGSGTWNPDTGQFEQSTNWGNLLSLGVGGALTGGALDAALAGGAGAGAAGGVAADALPSTTIGAGYAPAVGGAGLGAAGSGAGAASVVAPAATGGGVWSTISKYLPTAVPAVTGLIGSVIASNQSDKALQAQTDASNKALGLSQALYNARQQQIAPYVGTGRAALSSLSNLMGLPANAQSYQPPQVNLGNGVPTVQTGGTASLPPAVPAPMTSTQAPANGTVQMRAPTGEVQAVPTNQVSRLQALGAVVV